jgi:PAS domain S-box-containing protein
VQPVLDEAIFSREYAQRVGAKLEKKEQLLKESEEMYQLLYENSMDAILLTSPDGNIQAANPAACTMFGRTEEEIISAGRNGIVDSTDPRLPGALEERGHTGRFKGELTFILKDGTRFPGEVSSNVFTDHRGQTRTSMIIRDITERKIMEQHERQALQHIEKNLEQIATLNDQIRNPLAIIVARISLDEKTNANEQIMMAVKSIDEIVTKLDQRWAASAKVREFLRRYDQISGKIEDD